MCKGEPPMSLEILKPPTDTLYKFVAILGLLFFISSLVTPVFLSKQLGELKIGHIRELEVFVLETKETTEATKHLLRLASEQHEAHKELEQASHDYIDGKIPKAGFKLF